MATTIERTVVSTTQNEISTASFNGWELNFTVVSTSEGVTDINVSGQKDGGSVFASKNADGYINVGFSQGSIDTDLYLALITEILNIDNETTTT